MSRFPGAVLFDFDGVLVNTEPLHFAAFREVLRGERLDINEEEYFTTMLGLSDRDSFAYVFMRNNRCLNSDHLPELLARKSEMMLGHIQKRHFEPLPGVTELIPKLAATTPLAICSGARRIEIEAMLRLLGLIDCFQGIVSADDCKIGKPDPAGYFMAAYLACSRSWATLRPDDCIVVEDSPTVARSVKRVGFHVLAVTTSVPADYFDDADWVTPGMRIDDIAKVLPELVAFE